MGNISYQLLQKGHEVLFAFEEAIGYMFGTSVLDKDGVSAAAVMAECAVCLYGNGKTFASQLEACYQRWAESNGEGHHSKGGTELAMALFLWEGSEWVLGEGSVVVVVRVGVRGGHSLSLCCRYGRFISEVSYFICESKETIFELFHNLRVDKKVR